MPRAYSILKLNERDGQVELNWNFNMQLGYNIPARIKALSMKNEIEQHYRKSFENLKLALESSV